TLIGAARVWLGLTLTALAVVGVVPVRAALSMSGQRAPLWVAVVWQIIGYVAWILLTPWILGVRRRLAGRRRVELAVEAAAAIALPVVHAAALVVLSTMLLIPSAAGPTHTYVAALSAYLPLDVLTYVA